MTKSHTRQAFENAKVVLFVVVLALATTAHAAVTTCPGTRLVVLAGPRRAATSSVAEFFHKYARGAQPNRQHGRIYHPLAKFRWPLVYGEYSNETEYDMPYKRFNHLVTDPNNKELKMEIMDAIKRDYEINGVDAVIFGGEEFDQVMGGDSVEAHKFDAVEAVKEVVNHVGVPSECVTILLNYRVPRFEHWVSLYSSGMIDGTEMAVESDFMPYEEHMCVDDQSDCRLQELGTSMNPMYLAETYLNAGEKWQVKLIDMGGIEDFGTDISHTIGCNILGGVCDDDGRWVKGHIEETITNKVLQADFDSLPKEEVVLSERLFRYRDCAYEEDLRKNERFSVVMNKTVWSDCIHDKDHEWIYQSFRDFKFGTRLVFDALLSQIDCKNFGGHPSFGDQSHAEDLKAAKIEDFLTGTYQQNHNIFEEFAEEIESSFSAPLILVILMFAGGAGFYTMKMKQDPGYTIPSFEMGGFSNQIPSGGFGGGFSDKKDKKNTSDDEESSSDDESDSDDSGAGEFI